MTRKLIVFFFLIFFLQESYGQKPRLIVLTDIGQDPDDEQSLVRLLHYANEFQIEGLIATSDNNYSHESPVIREDIIMKMVDDYEKIEQNLKIHADFPDANAIRKTIKKGNYKGGDTVSIDQFIGKGFDTEGSDWIISVVDREDNRPVNIAVWGGACDLAQALWKVKNTRTSEELDRFISRIRVFFIGLQDTSNQWLIDQFPELWLIVAHSPEDNWESSYRGMFWGGDMSLTSREWIDQNIHRHTALADNYPDTTYTGGPKRNPYKALKEGDTPSFLFFVENGLNVSDHPEWGGWGGRFKKNQHNVFNDSSERFFDAVLGKEINSPRATVFRWRADFQNDFAARVDWGKSNSFEKANHPPIISLNGKTNQNPVFINSPVGKIIVLDASASTDPDNNSLKWEWIYYREAGNYDGELHVEQSQDGKAEIQIPKDASAKTLHVILRLSDDGEPSLCSYQRVIIQVE